MRKEEVPPPSSTAELAYGRTEERSADARATDEQRDDRDRRSDTPQEVGRRDERAPLLDQDQTGGFSSRWQDVQAKFVDAPQEAVREADGLVAEVIQSLATTFADQRQQLEDQWSRGGDASTEDLRQALMQYRSFFQRLLAA